MRALVVYESVFGNTRAVAEGITVGLNEILAAEVLPVASWEAGLTDGLDLLVIGGPTHIHNLTTATSRQQARKMAESNPDLHIDEHLGAVGIRNIAGDLGAGSGRPAAAFDTRLQAPPMFTGRASKPIARHLRSAGYRLVADPESFLVGKDNQLADGELDHAASWGRALAAAVTASH